MKKSSAATVQTSPQAEQEKKLQWQLNRPLLLTTLVVGSLLAAATASAYWYQSTNLASVIRDKAKAAGAEEDWEQKLVWLNQLLEIQPDSTPTIVELAFTADTAASVPPANRADKVNRARRYLVKALGKLTLDKSTTKATRSEVQKRLIIRESQLGQTYADDVLRQTIALAPPEDDATMLKAVAFAKLLLVDSDSTDKNPELSLPDGELTKLRQTNYWQWLAAQPLPTILGKAWRADPDEVRLAAAIFESEVDRPTTLAETLLIDDPECLQDVEEHLRSLSENGLAQATLLKYRLPETSNEADELIATFGLSALNRLVAAEANAKGSKKNASAYTLPSLEQARQDFPQVDFGLALKWLENSLNAKTTRPETAMQLEQLLSISNLNISATLLESAFLARARLTAEDEQLNEIEVLDRGITQLGVGSLQLQLIRSSLLAEKGEVSEATESVELLGKTIAQRKRLSANAGNTPQELAWRATEETRLAAAEWQIGVLQAELALRRNDLDDAVKRLKRATESQLIISPQAKFKALLLLAGIYKQQNLWDQAAGAYEQAARYATTPSPYEALAAEAWELAGNYTKAFQLWRDIKADSVNLSFKKIEALVNEQLQKQPASRNFTGIRELARAFNTQLEQLPAGEEQARELFQASTELLLLRMPDPKDGRERQPKVDRLVVLAERFPNNAQLRATAVIALARSERLDDAEKQLQEIVKKLGPDSPVYIATRARLDSLQGQVEEPIKMLTLAAKEQPKNAQQFLNLAAEIALIDGNALAAYQALMATPIEQVTPEFLYRRFSLALSDYETNSATQFDLNQLHEQCGNIKSIEGVEGTWWKLAEGTLALMEAKQDVPRSQQQRANLNKATKLANQITRARPRWGLAEALKGEIAETSGDYTTAVAKLKVAIANGDKRLATAARLTQLLIKLNRFEEAEEEYSRFERMQSVDPKIAAMGVYLGGRKGSSDEALELAKRNATAHERDEFAWLLLAQTGVMAARSASAKTAKDILLQEVKEALDTALTLSNNSSVNAYQLRLRFQFEFFGNDGARTELERLAKSNVAEPTRSLLLGLTYLQIRDMEKSLAFLTEAVAKAPKLPAVYTALATYHQAAGNEEEHLAMLKKAVRLAPRDLELRSRLALALALQENKTIPWDEIESLLQEQDSSTTANPVLHAMILMNRGSNEQKTQAESLLKNVIYTSDRGTGDARRLLASYYQQGWEQAEQQAPEAESTKKWFTNARDQYRVLANSKNPRPIDVYRYADLLLKAGEMRDAGDLVDQLESLSFASPLALEIRLRLANATGTEEGIGELTKLWADKNANSATGGASAVSVAGQVLARLGFTEESVFWLGRAYEEDDRMFPYYAAALVKTRKIEKVLAVCEEHYERTDDPNAIAVMADALVLLGDQSLSPRAEELFVKALQKHSSSPRLFEAIATLRLTTNNYRDAVRLYEHALTLAPNSVRVLNNLAIALSELDDRSGDALAVINRAIDLVGESPELLDTLGMVLFRTGNFSDAISRLREAAATSNDTRHRFHLLMALLETGDEAEALAIWSRLDFQELKRATLTPSERIALKRIDQQFNNNPAKRNNK